MNIIGMELLFSEHVGHSGRLVDALQLEMLVSLYKKLVLQRIIEESKGS